MVVSSTVGATSFLLPSVPVEVVIVKLVVVSLNLKVFDVPSSVIVTVPAPLKDVLSIVESTLLLSR